MFADTIRDLFKRALDHPKTREALETLQERIIDPSDETPLEDMPGFGLRVSGDPGGYKYNLTLRGELGQAPTVSLTVVAEDDIHNHTWVEDSAAPPEPPKGEVTTGPWEGSVPGPDDTVRS